MEHPELSNDGLEMINDDLPDNNTKILAVPSFQ